MAGGGGRANFDPSQMSDDQIRQMMSRYDLDGDGRISKAEAMQNNRIAQYFDAYASGGYMGVNEYRRFMSDRVNRTGAVAQIDAMNNGGPGGPGQNPNWGGQYPNWGNGQQMPPNWGGSPDMAAMDPTGKNKRGRGQPDEEEKKVVFRYGKLPKELPSWWESLDKDKDGQIGLYEWRSAIGGRELANYYGRELEVFNTHDLNGDGLITPEEWIKAELMQYEHIPGEKPDGYAARVGTGGSGRGGRGGPGGSYGGPGDRSTFGGTPGPNPFTTDAPAPAALPVSARTEVVTFSPDGGDGNLQLKMAPQRNSGNFGDGNNTSGRGNRGGNPDGNAGGGRRGGNNQDGNTNGRGRGGRGGGGNGGRTNGGTGDTNSDPDN
jgi:Ca2+-binding EF-hand superfamily protein